MSIFRNSKQVAFTELLVAVEEAVDNYEDLAKVLEASPVAPVFLAFAAERDISREKLETELRLLDDLPSPPNLDKEDLGKLVHRIRAVFAKDEVHPALQEMLNAEQHALELAKNCAKEELNQSEQKIIADLVQQVEYAIAELQRLAAAGYP